MQSNPPSQLFIHIIISQMSYKVWNPSPDIRLKTLEEKQQELLNSQGPSLEDFDQLANGIVSEAQSPFKIIKAKSFFSLECAKNSNHQDEVMITADDYGNIRAFYNMLFTCCFPKIQNRNIDNRIDQRRLNLIRSIKIFVLSGSTTFVHVSQQFDQPNYQIVLNDDRSMKRLIMQSLFLMSTNEDIRSLVIRFPILDIIFMSLIRTLVVIHHQYLPQMQSINKPISTDIIVNSLRAQFSIKVEYSNQKQIILDDYINYRQQNGNIFLRFQNDKMRDSGSFKKTTQTSDGNTESCKVLDTSKSLSDLMMMESKQEIMKEPIKFINKLQSVRRCDSIYSGGTELEFGSSADFLRRFSRQHDQSEDSELNMSYVVEKVAFGKPQDRPSLQHKQSKKPSKFAFFSKKSIEKQQESMKSIPTLVIHEIQQNSPNLLDPKVTTNLCTIPSVQQSFVSSKCSAMKESAMPVDLEQQNLKNKIYQGTTSDEVLRMLSPQIARTMLKKKQQSVKSLYSTISQIRTAGSIRSSFDMNEEQLSTKMNNLCQEITRRSSITGSCQTTTAPLKKSMWDRKPPEELVIPKLTLNTEKERKVLDLRKKHRVINQSKLADVTFSPPASNRKRTSSRYQSEQNIDG